MRRLPTRGRRLLAAAGLTAALAVPVAVFATMGTAASSTAAQSQYAPTNTGAPAISGTAQEGATLTASTGSWTSSSNVKYAYQWQRCNATGSACIDISGATAQTYVVQTADVKNTLRVVVTATNSDGASKANSAATAVVTAKTAQSSATPSAIKESNGRTSVSTSDISLPDRLVVDQVQFTPNPVRTLTTITAKFHVTDANHGYDVRDALVYAIGLPYSRVSQPAEIKTGTDGWATMTFSPAQFFPRKGYITFFVRARKAGDDLLAGVSTRRLVQVTIR